VKMLEEVPEELRITPERDQRLLAQAERLAGTDVVRLLDLVSAALEATANGAQPRIQLELVLIKATAPEVDPSAAALLARIERLEAALAGERPAPTPVPAPAPVPVPETAAAPKPKTNGGDPEGPAPGREAVAAAPEPVAPAPEPVAPAPGGTP